MNSEKMYICRKMRICSHLISKGINFERTEPSIKYPGRIVWIFKNTPEVKAAVDEYYNSDEFRHRDAVIKSERK